MVIIARDDTMALSDDYTCVQEDGVQNDTTTAEVDCTGIDAGTIKCFRFATTGKTEGSCGSCADSFADDGTLPTGDIAFPEAADGQACIGEQTCNLTAIIDFANPKFKVLAYCGEVNSTTAPTSAPSETPNEEALVITILLCRQKWT